MDNEMKICGTCKIEKNYIDFGKNKSAKDGCQSRCKLCRKQYCLENADKLNQKAKQWAIDNKDKRKQYYIDNVEHINQCNKQWSIDNPDYKNQWRKNNTEHCSKYSKQWLIDNPDYMTKYRIDNAEHITQKQKEYFQSPHGKLVGKANNHKRRELLQANTPIGKHFTPADLVMKLKLQKGKCVYCNKSLKDSYCIDHFIPAVKNGSNEAWNIQLLCKDCNGNGGKGSKLAYEYAQKHGKLF